MEKNVVEAKNILLNEIDHIFPSVYTRTHHVVFLCEISEAYKDF